MVNKFIWLPDGEPAIRAVFYWPEHRAVVETDGWQTHRTGGRFSAIGATIRPDRRGLSGRRLTHRQIHTEPDRLAALIWKMLGGGSAGR